MEFILVADVKISSLRTKICLETDGLNCTQKCWGLDYRTHSNLLRHVREKVFLQSLLTLVDMYIGSFAKKENEIPKQ